MSGAFKATSLPALDIEMHLLPIEQQIWKHNVEALGRLGPTTSRETAATQCKRRKKSPREAIEEEVREKQGPNLQEQERIDPFIKPPWWKGPEIYIEETAEKAQSRHQKLIEQEIDAIHIYTDGSGINGHIGAAAVCPTTQQTRCAYMGDENTSTVYAGELQGISLALQIIQEDKAKGHRRSKALIYTDNQAAIRSSANPKGKSGAYLLKDIAKRTEALREQGVLIELRWIPAHTGVQGNDELARSFFVLGNLRSIVLCSHRLVSSVSCAAVGGAICCRTRLKRRGGAGSLPCLSPHSRLHISSL
jgi:ribonuclease HI